MPIGIWGSMRPRGACRFAGRFIGDAGPIRARKPDGP